MSNESEFMAPAMPGEPRAALVVGGSVGAIIPQSVEEVWRLSNVFHRSGLAPQTLNSPEKVMVAVLAGAELGLAPFQAMSSFGVINGRPVLFGDGMLAVIRSRGFRVREWSQGSEDERIAHCEVTRPDNGEVVKRSFSVADAKVAGLWKKSGPWTTNPGRMLQMRARAFACRDAAADILRGFQMREEVEDYQEVRDVTPAKSGVGSRLAARAAPAEEGFTVENAEHVSAHLDEILDNDNFPIANVELTSEPDKPKRPRRTKAEMEAARAAEAKAEPLTEAEAVARETQSGGEVIDVTNAGVGQYEPGDYEARPTETGSAQTAEPEADSSASATDASTDTAEETSSPDDTSQPSDDGVGVEQFADAGTPEDELTYVVALKFAKTMKDVQNALQILRQSETWANLAADEQRGHQRAAWVTLDNLAARDKSIPSIEQSMWRFSNWLSAGAPGGEIEARYLALGRSEMYGRATAGQREALAAAVKGALGK